MVPDSGPSKARARAHLRGCLAERYMCHANRDENVRMRTSSEQYRVHKIKDKQQKQRSGQSPVTGYIRQRTQSRFRGQTLPRTRPRHPHRVPTPLLAKTPYLRRRGRGMCTTTVRRNGHGDVRVRAMHGEDLLVSRKVLNLGL